MVDPIRYTADGGGRVDIPFPLDPYEVLGIESSASLGDIKFVFKNKINQESRQNRAMVSIASHILSSTAGRYIKIQGTLTFKPIINPNRFIVKASSIILMHFGGHFLLTAAGHTERLENIIGHNSNIVHEEDEHKRTLLYLACKSGFYDTAKLLLTKGADVDKTQVDGSTPLHVAAYYGHVLLVGLLLEHGAATDIKNKWGNTALDESRTEEIKSLIRAASEDCISSLAAQLRQRGLINHKVNLIAHPGKKGEIIAKEFVRDPTNTVDDLTQRKWDHITNYWELVWHGTCFKNLQSILENGLFPAGTNGIKPPANHYRLGERIFGIDNWAAAIFVSPSILYAAHAAYAKRVCSKSKMWCVLVKAFCKPESYKAFHPTVTRVPVNGEPEKPEYRVPVTSDAIEGEPEYPEYEVPGEENRQVIYRVESARNVVVYSVMFVSAQYLESKSLTFELANQIFH